MVGEFSYFICTLPRSGSWLLADSLEATGIAGRPREYFEPNLTGDLDAVQVAKYVSDVIKAATTPNGVLGLKFHWHQFAWAEQLVRRIPGPSEIQTAKLMAACFAEPRYIWLTRRDKVRQAISYYRAIHTDTWWKFRGERNSGGNDPPFDFAAIECLEKILLQHETNWQRYFEDNEIDPFVVVYEDLKDAPEIFITELLNDLRIGCGSDIRFTTDLVPQSDRLSDEWAEEYNTLKEARASRLRWFIRTVSLGPIHPRELHQSSQRERPNGAVHAKAVSSATLLKNAPSDRSIPARSITSLGRRCRAMNKREIRVVSLQRSGHHGIIHWIAAQCEGAVLYLNDVEPGTNPFFTSTIASRLDLDDAPRISKACLDIFAERDYLIYSYEDRPLEAIFSEDFEQNHDVWVGSSGNRYDVVVLRDVFNTFASRMAASWMRHKVTDPEGKAQSIRLWKSYAREFLGETRHARHNLVLINYNEWFRNLEYRRQVAQQLNLPFSDAGLKIVAGRYGGSSFDGTSFNGDADKMGVLDRWKYFVNSDCFVDLFRDRELLELSNMIFGVIPGIQVFLR